MKNILKICCLLLTAALAPSALFSQTIKMVDVTQNAGKVEWLPRQIQTGDIAFDQPYHGEFIVKNLSDQPLILKRVAATCHCTLVSYTETPILPGETGKIEATYDAKKEGEFYKIITVLTNFDPEQSVALSMTGKVVVKN